MTYSRDTCSPLCGPDRIVICTCAHSGMSLVGDQHLCAAASGIKRGNLPLRSCRVRTRKHRQLHRGHLLVYALLCALTCPDNVILSLDAEATPPHPRPVLYGLGLKQSSHFQPVVHNRTVAKRCRSILSWTTSFQYYQVKGQTQSH